MKLGVMQPKAIKSQYLAFELAKDFQCVTSTEQLLEVTSFSIDQIVPLMNVPRPVMGIGNYRSEIIGIIDLPALLELPSLCKKIEQQSFHTIVVRHGEKIAGFAVNTIGQLFQIDERKIRLFSQTHLPRSIRKCVKSTYHPPMGKDMLVIDFNKIFDLLETVSNLDL